ncbi:MAG TPA: Gfo/Idh/MocA family oxidoreductase [Blastocatellia bacterium]|nr:Gfo/Idh/MocA family oxidoreductase [Blastocatellia bacterium]
MKSNKPTRRDFVKAASASALLAGTSIRVGASTMTMLPTWQSTPPAQQIAANDKIQIALIGAGGQGMNDTATALRVPGVELVAVADVYDGRLIRSKEIWGDHLFTTRDYREVLARPDVDAVIIATPDHWHMQAAIDALNAGKDVYVEKPMVQLIKDGWPVIEAERKTKRILQVGSQRVSSIIYKKAQEVLASGAIGQLNMVEAWWNRNSAIGAWQYSIPPDASEQTIDWDRYLGRAPKRPFEAIRVFRFRNYRDYGTGVGGDLFVHLFSGMHLIVNSIGPNRVLATGGLRHWIDGRDVPDLMLGMYDYPKTATHPGFNLFLKVNFADGAGSGESSGFRFIGTEGVITVGGSVTVSSQTISKEPGYTIDTFPKALQEEFLKKYRETYPEQKNRMRNASEDRYFAPGGYSDLLDHFTNFFESVRTRKPVVEDSVFGFRAAGPALLSNMSYFDSRPYGWNPESMKIIGE